MNFIDIVLLAIGLSMDAVAVSISNAICMNFKACRRSYLDIFKMAFAFGIFQGIMPLIGYFATSSFEKYITPFDHWIALILLAIIGGKMISESINSEEKTDCDLFSLTTKLLLVQAVATSIDALAVGISLSALNVNIFTAVLIISSTTFILCLAAILVAKRFGTLLGKRAGLVGGVILILIGLKIFIDHLFKG